MALEALGASFGSGPGLTQFRVLRLGFRVQGLGLQVQGLGLGVQG